MRRFRGNSGFYFMVATLVIIGMTGGCAKKQLPLNPPRVQAASGDFEGGEPPVGEEVAPPQADGVTASVAEPKSPAAPEPSSEISDITEETLSEASSSFPKGSSSPGSSPSSSPGSSPSSSPSSSPGSGPGSARSTSGKDLNVARMIPFTETSDLGDIHFKFDKHDLGALSKKTLAKNAQWLKTHPDVKVEVQGHCDERGTNNYNLGLADRRALNAKKYLIALGISADRLFTISYGEEKPFCVESNENCWWQNRRGHFRVSK